MQIAYLSDIGTRKKENQDFVGIFTNKNHYKLAVVADGVTSEKGGDVAAEMVVNNFGFGWRQTEIASIQAAKDWISEKAREENSRILEAGKRFDDLSKMATTMVLAVAIKDDVLVGNLGDSRAYIFNGKSLKQLSLDHSFGNELLKRGEVSQENVNSIPHHQSITRYFGLNAQTEMFFTVSKVANNDIIMLATDGLTKQVEEQDILRVIKSRHKSLSEMVAQLVNTANEQSGFDNVTILLMSQFKEGN
ncbi:protein phosphatase 2C domain-containing protein [Oenococcus sicerae]|uniref:protein phosphatase 2C domain-containing protein n=1 Tax=Oenococcus sicerae TaxID=2203724 RepID=UPI0039E88A1D